MASGKLVGEWPVEVVYRRCRCVCVCVCLCTCVLANILLVIVSSRGVVVVVSDCVCVFGRPVCVAVMMVTVMIVGLRVHCFCFCFFDGFFFPLSCFLFLIPVLRGGVFFLVFCGCFSFFFFSFLKGGINVPARVNLDSVIGQGDRGCRYEIVDFLVWSLFLFCLFLG